MAFLASGLNEENILSWHDASHCTDCFQTLFPSDGQKLAGGGVWTAKLSAAPESRNAKEGQLRFRGSISCQLSSVAFDFQLLQE
jgi:hypothetical protein